ncbi:MAG: hypothetical protein R3D27_13020 [Hyphomicrobiaceae bacterium]
MAGRKKTPEMKTPPSGAASAGPPGNLSEALHALRGLESLLKGAPGGVGAGLVTSLSSLGGDSRDLDRLSDELETRYPLGAMLVDAKGHVVAATSAMSRLFGVAAGSNIFAQDWEPETKAAVRKAVKAFSTALDRSSEIVQLAPEGRARLAAIEPYTDTTSSLLLIRLVGQPWHDRIAARLRTTFALSEAELALVEALYLGQRVREIADARGRAVDTVRTQLKSVMRKTACASQSALIAMVAAVSVEERPAAARGGAEVVRLASGEDVSLVTYGAPDGAPVVMFHTTSDPFPGERRAALFAKAGLRVIAPLSRPRGSMVAQDQLFADTARAWRVICSALSASRAAASPATAKAASTPPTSPQLTRMLRPACWSSTHQRRAAPTRQRACPRAWPR